MTSLPFVTWNVHACRGADGATRPDRIASVLRELSPRIAALQEVLSDSGPGPSDQAQFLAARLGLTPVEGVTLERDAARYGNLVLSALPVLEVARHDISVPGREPRGVLEVILDAGGPLRVVATHLGLARSERRAQGRRVLEVLNARALPTLLCGDLNEPAPFGGVARVLGRHLRWGPRRRTFPARWPLLPLDRVGVAGELRLEWLRTHRTSATRAASDHLPLHGQVRVVLSS